MIKNYDEKIDDFFCIYFHLYNDTNNQMEEYEQSLSCIVCYELAKTAMNTLCCHSIICENCSKQCDRCPICRGRINVVINIPFRRIVVDYIENKKKIDEDKKEIENGIKMQQRVLDEQAQQIIRNREDEEYYMKKLRSIEEKEKSADAVQMEINRTVIEKVNLLIDICNQYNLKMENPILLLKNYEKTKLFKQLMYTSIRPGVYKKFGFDFLLCEGGITGQPLTQYEKICSKIEYEFNWSTEFNNDVDRPMKLSWSHKHGTVELDILFEKNQSFICSTSQALLLESIDNGMDVNENEDVLMLINCGIIVRNGKKYEINLKFNNYSNKPIRLPMKYYNIDAKLYFPPISAKYISVCVIANPFFIKYLMIGICP